MNTDAPMIAGLRPCSENLREQANTVPSDVGLYFINGVALQAESGIGGATTVPYNIQPGFLEIQERNDAQDARIDDLQSQVDYLISQLHALQWAVNNGRPFV